MTWLPFVALQSRPGKITNRQSAGQAGSHFSLRRITILIFATSYLVYAFSPKGKPIYADMLQGGEIMLVSLNFLRAGTFANPFYWIPTGPTAHTAPIYVFLYSFVASLFGVGWQGSRVLWALNVGFLATQLALLPALSAELGLGVAPGVVAAILGAVVQPYQVLPASEALFTGALLVVLLVLTLKRFRILGAPSSFVSLGLLWGVAILTNPECVLLMFIWLYIAAMKNSPVILARARGAALWVVAGAALACLPWFVRNFEQFRSIFFVRDNFGLELFTSNNPCAGPDANGNLMSGCHWQTHPYGNRSIETDVADKGEIRFNEEMLHRALSWIWSNPRRFAWLTTERFVHFWFPSLGSPRYSVPLGILTVLSLPGLVWMHREHRRAAGLFSSTLLVYPLVHYIVQFEPRYRHPILWATLLPAAYALTRIIHWPGRESIDTPSSPHAEHELTTV